MKKSLISLVFCLLFILSARPVHGASTTMSAVPANGLYSAPFNMSVIIDGHGDVFNAARAHVSLSDSLTLQSIIPGDCHFTYIHEPSQTDPSFEGVMLGASATKCTVYSLVLIPKQSGVASVKFTNATVRRYGDAAEVLSTVEPSAYTLSLDSSSSPSPSPTQLMTVMPSIVPMQATPSATKLTSQSTLVTALKVGVITLVGLCILAIAVYIYVKKE